MPVDFTRSYGEASTYNGDARYYQDGVYYKADGVTVATLDTTENFVGEQNPNATGTYDDTQVQTDIATLQAQYVALLADNATQTELDAVEAKIDDLLTRLGAHNSAHAVLGETAADGRVDNGGGGLTPALDRLGAVIGNSVPVINFYDGVTGVYVNSLDVSPTSGDTNITSGTLAAAAADRTVDMGGNSLTITNADKINFNTANTGALQLPASTNPAGQVTSPINGMAKYDSTDHQVQAYVNGAWVDLLHGGNSKDSSEAATTSGTGTVDDGAGGTTAALDLAGAAIGNNVDVISFYNPITGAYVASIRAEPGANATTLATTTGAGLVDDGKGGTVTAVDSAAAAIGNNVPVINFYDQNGDYLYSFSRSVATGDNSSAVLVTTSATGTVDNGSGTQVAAVDSGGAAIGNSIATLSIYDSSGTYVNSLDVTPSSGAAGTLRTVTGVDGSSATVVAANLPVGTVAGDTVIAEDSSQGVNATGQYTYLATSGSAVTQIGFVPYPIVNGWDTIQFAVAPRTVQRIGDGSALYHMSNGDRIVFGATNFTTQDIGTIAAPTTSNITWTTTGTDQMDFTVALEPATQYWERDGNVPKRRFRVTLFDVEETGVTCQMADEDGNYASTVASSTPANITVNGGGDGFTVDTGVAGLNARIEVDMTALHLQDTTGVLVQSVSGSYSAAAPAGDFLSIQAYLEYAVPAKVMQDFAGTFIFGKYPDGSTTTTASDIVYT